MKPSIHAAIPAGVAMYIAVVQFLFVTTWTVYVIFLPSLLASAGLPASLAPVILMVDQLVFMAMDIYTGVAADRAQRTVGKVGPLVIGMTVVSCIAFLLLPFVAQGGAVLALAAMLVWTATSSALRAPPWVLLGKYAAAPSMPRLNMLMLLGLAAGGAMAPYLGVVLKNNDPRLPFVLSSLSLLAATAGIVYVERRLKASPIAPPAGIPLATEVAGKSWPFLLALLLLAIGFQVHYSMNSATQFLKFTKADRLEWLMPVFWIGFGITMLPGSALCNCFGTLPVMAISAVLGALGTLLATLASTLDVLIAAQVVAGGAWGSMLMCAFTAAMAAGVYRARRFLAGTDVLDACRRHARAHCHSGQRRAEATCARSIVFRAADGVLVGWRAVVGMAFHTPAGIECGGGMSALPVAYTDVASAARTLHGHALLTPVMTSRTVDARSGAQVFFKCENLQRAGAFKFRGAFNALSNLTAAQKQHGVVAYSSGNHAQAVALAGQLLGIKAVIVMPADAPAVKVAATRGYGAEVVLYDREREDREAISNDLAQRLGLTPVPPFDHPYIVAGQGTAAKELVEAVGALDYLLVPCGGGGLLSGCAIAARELCPSVKCIGVEPAAGDDVTRSFYTKTIQHVHNPDTIADGARTSAPGAITFPLILHHVHDMLTVTDEELLRTMFFMWERMKLMVEPTGALAAAALLERKLDLRGKRVGVVVSGGNADVAALVKFIKN